MSTSTREVAKEVAKEVEVAKEILSKAKSKAAATKDKILVEKVSYAEKTCDETVKYVSDRLNKG